MNSYQQGLDEAEQYRDQITNLIEAARASDQGIYTAILEQLGTLTETFKIIGIAYHKTDKIPHSVDVFMGFYASEYAMGIGWAKACDELMAKSRTYAEIDRSGRAPYGPYEGTTMNDLVGY